MTLVIGVIAAFGLGSTGVAQAYTCGPYALYYAQKSASHMITQQTAFSCDGAGYKIQWYNVLGQNDSPYYHNYQDSTSTSGWEPFADFFINDQWYPPYNAIPCGVWWWSTNLYWRIDFHIGNGFGPWHLTQVGGSPFDAC